MGRRRMPNAGKITDYSQADMQDRRMRRKALDDYIGKWCGGSREQRAELVEQACRQADASIEAELGAGRSPSHKHRHSAPVDGSEAEPLTLETAWKAWV
jgi:hypothetical protein